MKVNVQIERLVVPSGGPREAQLRAAIREAIARELGAVRGGAPAAGAADAVERGVRAALAPRAGGRR